MLVSCNRGGCGPIAADDPEARRRPASKSAGFALNRLAQDLCEGHAAPTGFGFQYREVIMLGRHGCASNGHASDASITSSLAFRWLEPS
jgi:hypothetical protein